MFLFILTQIYMCWVPASKISHGDICCDAFLDICERLSPTVRKNMQTVLQQMSATGLQLVSKCLQVLKIQQSSTKGSSLNPNLMVPVAN